MTTDWPGPVQLAGEMAASSCSADPAREAELPVQAGDADDCIRGLYQDHFDFVWRNLRRLGVPGYQLDDATQDVFLVAHRRFPDFEPHAEPRAWLFGISYRVAADHRKATRRRERWFNRDASADAAVAADPDPQQAFAEREATRHVQALLDTLDLDKRAVLILVDLEDMTVPEAARALGWGLDSAYGRLRRARDAFKRAYCRAEAEQQRRPSR